MKLTFLGTGTSTGVPQIGCRCKACTSRDPKDRRLRASVLVDADGHGILIDCGPDLRTQLLYQGSPDIDALLITHSHYDHVGGIDDMRPYCAGGPFPVYCKADVAGDLRSRVPYCFAEHPYPGVPVFDIHEIDPDRPFRVGDVEVVPLPVMHYRLSIVGFRIGNLAYITDCKTIPSSTIDRLRGVDTLVINALRHAEHMSHINLAQALEIIGEVSPRRAYLTHISHDMGLHADVEPTLPPDVRIAYDGLEITIPD